MRLLIISAVLMVIACGSSPTDPQQSTNTYTISYRGTIWEDYSIWYLNPESGDPVHEWGEAPTWGIPWESREYEAESGQTIWVSGSSSIVIDLEIVVDDSIWIAPTPADSVYVEYVLP